MQTRVLLLAASLLVVSACITQRVELPPCRLSCCDAPQSLESGSISVVLTWEGESAKTYSRWLNSGGSQGAENVKKFHAKMAEALRDGLGAVFPRVPMPSVSRDEALALARVSGAGGVRQATPSQADASSRSADSQDPLDALEDAIEYAVDATVRVRNGGLQASGYGHFKREVNYIIEQGVTYCVYHTDVAIDRPNTNGALDWWDVSLTVGQESVRAYLDLAVVVRKID